MTQEAIDLNACTELLAARLLVHASSIGEAQHRPNTSWDAQRSQADMIRCMRPRTYFGEALRYHHEQFREAQQHMRRADFRRVTGFTGLSNPFNQNQRLTDYVG